MELQYPIERTYETKIRLPVMQDYQLAPVAETIEDRLGFRDVSRKHEILTNALPFVPTSEICNF